MCESPKSSGSDPELEERKKWELDVRTAYQVAADLYMQENTVTWARFNAMVAANAIITAAIGIGAPVANKLPLFVIILPMAGFFLCLTWLIIMRRGFAYHDVWRDSAYSLEMQFSPRVQTLHYAHQLRSNETAQIKIKNPNWASKPHNTPKPRISMSYEQARRAVQSDLRANRSLLNTEGGYWVLNTDPTAARHMEVGALSLDEAGPIRGLLVSDGFYRLVDTLGVYQDDATLLHAALERGLADMLCELRALAFCDA